MNRSVKVRLVGSMEDVKELLDYLDHLGINYTRPGRLYGSFEDQNIRAYIEVYEISGNQSLALDIK